MFESGACALVYCVTQLLYSRGPMFQMFNWVMCGLLRCHSITRPGKRKQAPHGDNFKAIDEIDHFFLPLIRQAKAGVCRRLKRAPASMGPDFATILRSCGALIAPNDINSLFSWEVESVPMASSRCLDRRRRRGRILKATANCHVSSNLSPAMAKR